jgi:hypothetical protein
MRGRAAGVGPFGQDHVTLALAGLPTGPGTISADRGLSGQRRRNASPHQRLQDHWFPRSRRLAARAAICGSRRGKAGSCRPPARPGGELLDGREGRQRQHSDLLAVALNGAQVGAVGGLSGSGCLGRAEVEDLIWGMAFTCVSANVHILLQKTDFLSRCTAVQRFAKPL